MRYISLLVTTLLSMPAFCCTNLLVGRSASTDGSTFITYNMDCYGMYARLRLIPGGVHQSGETIEVWNHDIHHLMGTIPQAPVTYKVLGYINEKQLSITESTFGGRSGQENPDGIIHYTALIELALQRAATAREAINVMAELVEQYGYASSGESFSIADPKEVWIMEMIGKGADEKGAVWVAVRIPDDCICVHSNQSRIHTFDMEDKENVLFSKDVVTYAQKKGFFSGRREEFDFSAAYSPANFHTQRISDARSWSIFNRFVDGMERYLDFVDGHHIGSSEIMPLYFHPERKVSLRDAMDSMRDHFEETPFNMIETGLGGPWESPYHPRPQEWEFNGRQYFFERPVATQHCACTMVCQMRSFLPDEVGGVIWWGNDDANMIVYTPHHIGDTRVPVCYDTPDASDIEFSWNSAFWVCNWISNMVYPRYSRLFPDLLKVREELQEKYIAACGNLEAKALELEDTPGRSEQLTSFSEKIAEDMMTRWKNLGIYLIVKHNDIAVKPEADGKFTITEDGIGTPPVRDGYPESYRKSFTTFTGDRYLIP